MAGINDRVQSFIESWPTVKQQLEELTIRDSQKLGKEEIIEPGVMCEGVKSKGIERG